MTNNISTYPIQKLVKLFDSHRGRILVLTGAGCSTGSGLDDYRGQNGVYLKYPNFKPISYQNFLSDLLYRKRYWSRSFFGYKKILFAKPNPTHFILATLERLNFINCLITQNVDNLHLKAGSKKVIELHGCLNSVYCLGCKKELSRLEYQSLLEDLNPTWTSFKNNNFKELKYTVDGDVVLPNELDYSKFKLPKCQSCLKENSYKPKVIFFGENISEKIKTDCYLNIDNCSMVLVIGSSLATPSALNILKRAYKTLKYICIVNLDHTKGDKLASLVINENCTNVLTTLLKQMKISPHIVLNK